LKYQTARMGDGDEKRLKLAHYKVEAINTNSIGYFKDSNASLKTYRRVIKRDSNPQFADIQVPDGALIINATHSTVDFLVEVDDE